MTSTASSGSPPEGSKPEDATPPKPRRPPRASAATTARGTTSTPPKPTTPPRPARRRGAAARRAGVPEGRRPRDARRAAAPAGVSRARGFDLELTRDLAKRESALRFGWSAGARARGSDRGERDVPRVGGTAASSRRRGCRGSLRVAEPRARPPGAQAVGDGAAQVARLEEQCARQRRMLRELAVASEALAKDNVLLSSELVALRDRGDEAESLAETLSERLRAARKLYLANQKSLARAEETRVSLPDGRWEKKLDQLLTADVLARSKPPPAFPAEVPTRAARRRRDVGVERPGAIRGGSFGPRAKPSRARSCRSAGSCTRRTPRCARAWPRRARRRPSCASGGRSPEPTSPPRGRRRRQGADAAGAAGGRRAAPVVAGGARGRAGGVRAEKDAYAASLERRLLAQHKTVGAMTRAAARGARAGGARIEREAREENAGGATREESVAAGRF